MIVAIDGPAGSGKGTVTKEIAKRMGLINLDTGATYRCVALASLKHGIKLEEEDKIVLSSYEIPEGEDKGTFSYSSMKNVDYTALKKSEKFTPAIYHEKDGIWEGGSVSQFSPVMTFRLWEKFSDSCLEVSESMEVNGKKTFGYDEPIIYKRV